MNVLIRYLALLSIETHTVNRFIHVHSGYFNINDSQYSILD